MTRINLVPRKEAQIADQRRQQLSIVILGTCLVALLMIVPYVLQKRQIAQLDGEVDQLRVEVAKYEELTKEAKDLDKKRKELQTKLDVIRDLDKKRVGPSHVLLDLSGSVPEKLWIEDFTESGGVASIVGWALDNQTVAAFMRQLGASDYFNNVDLTEATQPEGAEQVKSFSSDSGTVRFKRFVIKTNVNYFGKSPPKPVDKDAPAGAAEEAKPDADNQPKTQAQQSTTRANT